MKQFRSLYALIFSLTVSFSFASDLEYTIHNDSIKAQKYSDRAWALKDKNPDSSYFFAYKALEIAQSRNFKKLEAYSLSDIGNYYKRKEDYPKSKSYLLNSLEVRKDLSDSIDIASGYNLLGILYNQQGEYDTALTFFKKGISWLKENKKHQKLRIKIIDGMATSFLNTGLYEEAQEYLLHATEDALLLNDSIVLAKCWHNQGVLYERIGRSEIALDYYSRAEAIYRNREILNSLIDILINKGVTYLHRRDFKEAINLFLESEVLSIENGFLDNLSSLHNNIGIAYLELGQYQLSEQQFRKGIERAISLEKPQKRIESELNLIRLMRIMDRKNEILNSAQQLEGLIKEYGGIRYITLFYDHYSWAYGELGQFEKAYQIKSKANHLKDSLNKILDEAQKNASELERLSKEKEILRQQALLNEASLKEKIYKQQLFLIIAFATIFMLTLTTVIFYLKRRNSKQKLLLSKADNKILFEREKAEKLVRKEISEELHDHMTRELSLVHMKMDDIIDKVPNLSEKLKDEYKRVGKLLEDYYQHVRQIAHKLNRSFTSDKLELRIEELLNQVGSTGKVATHLSMDRIPKILTLGIEEDIVGIISLALDNVIKHSKASEVSVQLYSENNFLHLSIEDDGIGFELEKHSSNGIGMENLEERSKRLGADLTVESIINQGTLIFLKIPLNKKK